MASNLESKPPRNDCTTTCWRLRSPTCSPGSPGRFSARDAPSKASRRRRRRPDLLDPRAVLGAVKAPPGGGRARRQEHDGRCAYRKSNPEIFVMQSAEDRAAKNTPCPLYGAQKGEHPCPRLSASASHYSSEREIAESGADVPRPGQ
jgi:hypothetical protein